MTTQTFSLHGMHCQACVARVTKALSPLVLDAASVKVDLQQQRVSIGASGASLAQLQAAVASAGKYVLAPLVATSHAPKKSLAQWLATYKPLLLVFLFITVGAAVLTWRAMPLEKPLHAFMLDFMAGFFLVFGFFKLLDLRAFADAYKGYDLLARRLPVWGLAYPFVEIALGLAYLTRWNLGVVNWIALLVMWFSALGVLNALMNRRQIRCACLGSVFNLPMSTVTLVEDMLMVAMAAWMLLGK